MYLPNSGKNNANKRSMLPSGSFVFWKWNKQAVREFFMTAVLTLQKRKTVHVDAGCGYLCSPFVRGQG